MQKLCVVYVAYLDEGVDPAVVIAEFNAEVAMRIREGFEPEGPAIVDQGVIHQALIRRVDRTPDKV